MVAPLTPKLTRKAEALARAPPTIALCREIMLKKKLPFFFPRLFLSRFRVKGRGKMHYTLIPPAYPYFPASPYPYPAYPSYEAYGSFATEPAGAAAGAFDPQFSLQPFG
jgi:hypothetical protein